MTNCPSTPKPFRADGGDISTGRLKEIADNPYGDEEKCWLAKRVLASLEVEPVAWRCGSTVTVNKPVADDWKRRGFDFHPLYAATPAKMLEIENLEHFISFWKKVQAGQMKPGKNDIDHMVWFLEGISNLTAPPAPVVPEEATPENIEILASTFAPRGVTYQWDRDECNAAADSWNACRAAMLQGAENTESRCSNSPVIPDGWKLVPIVPTEKMVIEGFESEPDEFFSKSEVWEAYQKMSGCEQAAHRAKLCWAAMISAAPQQEVKL